MNIIKRGIDAIQLNAEICKENLEQVVALFIESDICFYVVFGTLLGFYRDKDFISYDKDIDVAILHEDFDKFQKLIISDKFNETGFVIVRDEPGIMSIQRKDIYIDIYVFKFNNEVGKYVCHDYILTKDELSKRIKLETYLDVDLYTINNIEDYLCRHYGDNWMIPQKGFAAMNTYNMSKNHWENFYKENKPDTHSTFAEFCIMYLDKKDTIIDVGCGAGEDVVYFSNYCKEVVGVDDYAIFNNTANISNVGFIKKNFYHLGELDKKFDVVYMRWVLHSVFSHIGKSIIDMCVKMLNTGGKLLIETRTINDDWNGRGIKLSENEYIYNHYRRFIDPAELKSLLQIRGFEFLYFSEKKGWSYVSEDNNPSLLRIVAKKRCPLPLIEEKENNTNQLADDSET